MHLDLVAKSKTKLCAICCKPFKSKSYNHKYHKECFDDNKLDLYRANSRQARRKKQYYKELNKIDKELLDCFDFSNIISLTPIQKRNCNIYMKGGCD